MRRILAWKDAVLRFLARRRVAVLVVTALSCGCSDPDGGDGGYQCPTSGTGWWEELPYPTIGIPSGSATMFAGSTVAIWGEGINDPSLSRCTLEADCQGVAGARLDLPSRTWSRMSEVGAPAPRSYMGAATDGALVMYWGGTSFGNGTNPGDGPLTDGGIYDAEHDTWEMIPDAGFAAAREYPSLEWMGNELFVWGGYKYNYSSATTDGSDIGYQFNGLIWHPERGTWTEMSTVNAPDLPAGQSKWTGREVLVFTSVVDAIGREWGWAYEPATDTWRVLNHVGATSNPRRGLQPLWTGKEAIKFEGSAEQSHEYYGSGRAYNPTTDTWRTLNPNGAPHWPLGGKMWTGTQAVVMGGAECPVAAIYDPAADEWVGNSAPLPYGFENLVHTFNTPEGLLLLKDVGHHGTAMTGFLWHPE